MKPIVLYLSSNKYPNAWPLHVEGADQSLFLRAETSKAEDGEHPMDVAEPREGELTLNVIWPDDVLMRPDEQPKDTINKLIMDVVEASENFAQNTRSCRLERKMDHAISKLESFCNEHLKP